MNDTKHKQMHQYYLDNTERIKRNAVEWRKNNLERAREISRTFNKFRRLAKKLQQHGIQVKQKGWTDREKHEMLVLSLKLPR